MKTRSVLRNAIVYNPDFSSPPNPLNRFAILLNAVRALLSRHVTVLRHRQDDRLAPALLANQDSLDLAQAFLESNLLPADRPLQIAVIGPTQAGKSTIVNGLLGEIRAGVSPLAGYTIHPHAFPVNVPQGALAWLDHYFHEYQRFAPVHLPIDRYDCYGLAEPLSVAGHSLPPCVLWDTPDFDSVDSAVYRAAVRRTAALADVLVVVVSKDKYADQSVWDTLALLEPLAQATVLCLNKTPREARKTLVRSLAEKWRGIRHDPFPSLTALPYLDELDEASLAEWNSCTVRLREAVAQAARMVDRAKGAQNAVNLLRRHWDAWLAPVRVEWQWSDEWRDAVDSALNEAVMLYRRDYLDRPRHYETFQRALAELLTLLEIPGLASMLSNARRLVTWPVRQLIRLGSVRREKNTTDSEPEILARIVDHVFIRLGDSALDHGGDTQTSSAWWRGLGQILRETRETTGQRFTEHVEAYRRAFQPQIERTARQLFERLREHPALLNSLRATRVTTDAAALAAALHTGGLGIHDFIIAPAILSVTSILTESALGRYMHKAEAELKARQFEQVRALFEQKLRDTLLRLPERLPKDHRFDLAPETLEPAETILRT